MCKQAERYRLSRTKQYPDSNRIILTAILIISLLIGIGMFMFLMWGIYGDYSTFEEKITKAETDRQEILDILAGKLVMHDKGQKYGQIATVTWTTVQED